VQKPRSRISHAWAPLRISQLIIIQILIFDIFEPLTARCHFTGPQKASNSRAQPSPTCPHNGSALIQNISTGPYKINRRCINSYFRFFLNISNPLRYSNYHLFFVFYFFDHPNCNLWPHRKTLPKLRNSYHTIS
jgi:hypothetical protein